MKNCSFYIGMFAVGIQACSNGVASVPPDRTTNIRSDTATVEYSRLVRNTFSKELVCNGRLSARRKAVLRFRQNGMVASVHLQNGQRVSQGQIIAALDRNRLSNTLETKKIQLAQSRLDYEDRLLSMGYNVKDSASLPANINQAALIRSGYKQNSIDLTEAGLDYEQAVIIAPFSGIIANLDAQPFNMSDTYTKCCTLIDDSEFMVDFNVIEAELPFIRASKEIAVIPFNDPSHVLSGRVVSVNPSVDESGMISIRAIVPNTGHLLLDGMNVRIMAKQQLKGQLIVPKEAIVERQGRKVVFTCENGYAIWNYIETGLENSYSCTVLSGLKENDQIIWKGNFNLAHNKPIKASLTQHP